VKEEKKETDSELATISPLENKASFLTSASVTFACVYFTVLMRMLFVYLINISTGKREGGHMTFFNQR
jgi:hypothetical protein